MGPSKHNEQFNIFKHRQKYKTSQAHWAKSAILTVIQTLKPFYTLQTIVKHHFMHMLKEVFI